MPELRCHRRIVKSKIKYIPHPTSATIESRNHKKKENNIINRHNTKQIITAQKRKQKKIKLSPYLFSPQTKNRDTDKLFFTEALHKLLEVHS